MHPSPLARLVASTALLLAFGCGSGSDDADGGLDAASLDGGGARCEADPDCDDGAFCNGVERCVDDRCGPGPPPCGDGSCDEDADECSSDCPDADGDGATDQACGGADCDDNDPLRFPGASEVCDVDDRDEDCDPRTFGVRDADSDGSPDALCCNGDNCGDDCDDSRGGVNPSNPEVCDGIDNDCDGRTDEGVLLTFTVDADGDGDGSDVPGAETIEACSRPLGFADNTLDCDDGNGAISSDAEELCNGGGDENCNGEVDEDCTCTAPGTRDCPGALGACAAGQQTCVAGVWSPCSVAPQPETCDGADNDCNGDVDDGVGVFCYDDPDRDDFATGTAAVTRRCACLASETTREPVDADSTDCREAAPDTTNPLAARTHPGADEVCDGVDNDCSEDGGADQSEDFDGDGFTAEGFSGCSGGPYPRTDCEDRDADRFPGASGQTTGFCEGDRIPCPCGTDGVRCVESRAGTCAAATCSRDDPPPSFDYNCSGADEPQDVYDPGGCRGSCVCRTSCGPSSTPSTEDCGEAVAFTCCPACSGCFAVQPVACR